MNLRDPAVRRASVPRFRLVDGVILAAVAVLALRVLGLFSSFEASSSTRPSNETAPSFARVLSHARSNYEPADPTETGSVSEHGAPAAPAAPDPAASAAPEPKPAPPPPPPMPSASERAILQRLGERREELQTRSREMESREKLLEEQEKKLDERIGELKASQEKAQATGPGKRADAEAGGLKNLVTMYETMKPKEAARVFDRLPQDVLVSVVTQMNPRKMAEVLALMTPEGAQKLTVALARRSGGADDPRAVAQAGALPAGELPAIVPGRR